MIFLDNKRGLVVEEQIEDKDKEDLEKKKKKRKEKKKRKNLKLASIFWKTLQHRVSVTHHGDEHTQ